MIIRILGEGQYDVADSALDRLNDLDAGVESAVGAGDEEAFRAALARLLDGVRTVGVPHPLDAIDESDLILPGGDASMEEVSEMLSDEGLIPG
ncbi:PspA-associated protein PspAA [Nocardioides cheoyonin]|uniref:PspA-associated protein PspAA n=1 Tax=Nocardioides cheoyonin TaxID=3156615 RepID=UPI0032B32268